MTFPPGGLPGGPDDRIPTQAELDAEDLAEIARKSNDSDHRDRYPARPPEAGPAPAALVRDARVLWIASGIACVVWILYGLIEFGRIRSLMEERLMPGLAPDLADAREKAHQLAGFWPIAFMVGIPLLLALTWPMLVWIAKGHSRNLRSVYLSTIVVLVLFIPVCADLMFNYPEIPRWVGITAWIQAGLLVLSGLSTLRRDVGRWLPPSMRMKPMRMVRGE